MSLRRRMTVTVAAAVGGFVLLASVIAYVAVRAELRGQVDAQLRAQADFAAAAAARITTAGVVPPEILSGPRDPGAGPPAAVRVIENGDTLIERGGFDLQVPAPDGEQALSDEELGGESVRVLTAPIGDGRSIQIARPLESVESALANLRTVLFIVVMAGAALGALAARLIANRMLAPVAGLTEAAEHVSETEDLSRRIQVSGDDEVARLAERFNGMLEGLEASRAALDRSHSEQRQLIADASHELRTPVTSLRTNVELIAGGKLPDGEIPGALEDALAQTEELGDVIGDLMDLARGEAPDLATEDVRLDHVAAEAVDRARRHSPGVSFELDTEPCIVTGAPDRIARAVNNLLDNAAQHADGAPVEVSVSSGRVRVRDHGNGIDPAEADRLFDRFYRGDAARTRPGSGLGLAIVRQVAEAHGGSVAAANAEGGGALFSLQLWKKRD
jgi:two-component system sensor histidine kinase MprB